MPAIDHNSLIERAGTLFEIESLIRARSGTRVLVYNVRGLFLENSDAMMRIFVWVYAFVSVCSMEREIAQSSVVREILRR